MGTVKDVCWSTKYRQQLQKSHKKEDAPTDQEPTCAKPVKTKNRNTVLKFSQKNDGNQNNHDVAQELADSIEVCESASIKKQESEVSLCLKAGSSPNMEDLSKHQGCSPDCPYKPTNKKAKPEKPEKLEKCKLYKGKESPCPGVLCASNDPEKLEDKSEDPESCSTEKPASKEKEVAKEKVKTPKKSQHKCHCFGKDSKNKKSPKHRASKSTSSIMAINESIKANCCACCCLLADYFKEILRLFSIKNDTRVSEIFCEMCEVASCLCKDCLNFLKKILHCVCNLNSKTC